MKARIIYEFKDEKIQEILKENDITSAAELKGWLKSKLQDGRSGFNVDHIYMDLNSYDMSIDVDYDSPMLKKCGVPGTIKLVDELRAEIKSYELAANMMCAKYNTLNDKYAEAVEENNKLINEIEKLQTKYDELTNQPSPSEYEAKIEDLEKEVAGKRCIIKSYEKMIGSRNDEIKELQKQNNELMDKIELLEDTPVECSTCCVHNKCQAFEKEITKLKGHIEVIEDKVAALEEENDRLKRRNEFLEKDIGDYDRECLKLEKKIKELQEKYDQVLEFNDNLHEGNAELYKQNENLMKDIKDLKKRNEELTQELLDTHSVNLKLREVEHKLGQKTAYTHIIDKLGAGYCISNPIYNDSPKKKYTRDEVYNAVNEVLLDYKKGLRSYFQSELDAIK